MEITPTTAKRSAPLKAVAGSDGHNYYVLNAEGSAAIAPVIYVAYYSSLEQFIPERAGVAPYGFYFVRDAASSGADHYGDPTVHKGWAMYIWDNAKYRPGVTNSGWVKIAQQGDVDWDIDDELKAKFVLKTVFNARVNAVDTRFAKDEGIIKGHTKTLVDHEQRINEVERCKHEHFYISEEGEKIEPNLDVLNRLSDKYKSLYYRGRPIMGNSYIYDQILENKLVWIDPTASGEVEPEIVKNSTEIAKRFVETDLARIGMTLFVMEADGSISIFKLIRQKRLQYKATIVRTTAPVDQQIAALPRDAAYFRISALDNITRPVDIQDACEYIRGNVGLNDIWYYETYAESMAPDFAQTIVEKNYGVPEYTDYLPYPTATYEGRGCWVPLKDDGKYTVGHLHQCVYQTPTRNVNENETFVADGSRISYRVKRSNLDLSLLTASDVGTVLYFVNGDLTPMTKLETFNVTMDRHPITGEVLDHGTYTMIKVSLDNLERLQNSGKIATAAYSPVDKTDATLLAYVAGNKFTADAVLNVLVTDSELEEMYIWKDLIAGAVQTALPGAEFKLCYAEDGTLWKEVRLSWKDPEDAVEDGVKVVWAKTTVVRKTGSVPASIGDGTVVATISTKDRYLTDFFEDTVPFTTEPVYYRLFSTTQTGVEYVASDAWMVHKLDWDEIKSFLGQGYGRMMFHTAGYNPVVEQYAHTDSTAAKPYYYTYHSPSGTYQVFEIKAGEPFKTNQPIYTKHERASEVVLSYHDEKHTYAADVLPFEVVAIDSDANDDARKGILLAAKYALYDKMEVDVEETQWYVEATEEVAIPGKPYYAYNATTHVYTRVTPSEGDSPHQLGWYYRNEEHNGTDRGSNGDLVFGANGVVAQNLGTLNIIRWLNSANEHGIHSDPITPWDFGNGDGPSYAGHDDSDAFAGFVYRVRDFYGDDNILSPVALNGIQDDDGKTLINLTGGRKLLVTLPMTSKSYFSKISKNKLTMESYQETDWFTLTGRTVGSSETSMRLYDQLFMGDGTTTQPTHYKAGIVPIVFIGGTDE